MKRPSTLALLAINLALALALLALWITPQGKPRNIRWTPPAPVRPDINLGPPLPPWNTDFSRFVATLDRPIFSASRRPEPKADAVPVDSLSEVALVGLYGAGPQAGVIARISGQTRRVRVGEPLAGWTLKEVQHGGAVLVRGDETRSLQVKRGPAPP